ncbi:unnamed protein product [Pylaiella littoralis]
MAATILVGRRWRSRSCGQFGWVTGISQPAPYLGESKDGCDSKFRRGTDMVHQGTGSAAAATMITVVGGSGVHRRVLFPSVDYRHRADHQRAFFSGEDAQGIEDSEKRGWGSSNPPAFNQRINGTEPFSARKPRAAARSHVVTAARYRFNKELTISSKFGQRGLRVLAIHEPVTDWQQGR